MYTLPGGLWGKYYAIHSHFGTFPFRNDTNNSFLHHINVIPHTKEVFESIVSSILLPQLSHLLIPFGYLLNYIVSLFNQRQNLDDDMSN